MGTRRRVGWLAVGLTAWGLLAVAGVSAYRNWQYARREARTLSELDAAHTKALDEVRALEEQVRKERAEIDRLRALLPNWQLDELDRRKGGTP